MNASTCTIYRTDISNSVVTHTGYIATIRHKNWKCLQLRF